MTTPKLGLPELVANQSQPHLTVNSALRRAEGSIQLSVLDRALNTPPGSPAEGDAYIVGAAPTGLWSAYSEGDVAFYSGGAWLRLVPLPGWLAFVQDEELFYYVSPAVSPPAWTILETGGSSSPAPGGGLEPYQRVLYRVLDLLDTPPGSPTAGDIYRVGEAPTGDWSAYNWGNLAHYNGTAWEEVEPPVGSLLFDSGNGGVYYVENSGAPRSWISFYDEVNPPPGGGGEEKVYVHGYEEAVVPDDAILLRWVAPRAGRIEADFAGSIALEGTSPSADWTAEVWAGGSTVGTITVASAGGVTMETTLNEEQYFSAGDYIFVIAPYFSPETGPETFDVVLQLILEAP